MKLLALIGALGVGLVAVVAARGQEATRLVANVGPGFEIGLTHPDGRQVSVLAPGSYTIEVHDRSDIHNFKLANKPDGLRVNIDSGVEFVGEKSFTVDLRAGGYGYACSPHWETMNGSFAVVEPAGTTPATIVAARLPATVVPRAGRLFALRGLTVQLSNGQRVRPTLLQATASIAGRRLARTAPLAWRIPQRARGKILVLAVRTGVGALRGAHTLRLRIR